MLSQNLTWIHSWVRPLMRISVSMCQTRCAHLFSSSMIIKGPLHRRGPMYETINTVKTKNKTKYMVRKVIGLQPHLLLLLSKNNIAS